MLLLHLGDAGTHVPSPALSTPELEAAGAEGSSIEAQASGAAQSSPIPLALKPKYQVLLSFPHMPLHGYNRA